MKCELPNGKGILLTLRHQTFQKRVLIHPFKFTLWISISLVLSALAQSLDSIL